MSAKYPSSKNLPQQMCLISQRFKPNIEKPCDLKPYLELFTLQICSRRKSHGLNHKFPPVQQQPVISQPTNPGSGQPIQSPPLSPTPPATYIPAVEQWRSTVTTAILNYGGPASDTDRFLRIMHCESRGQPNATNASSGAAGLMQHMPQYWDQRAISAGYAGSSPYDLQQT